MDRAKIKIESLEYLGLSFSLGMILNYLRHHPKKFKGAESELKEIHDLIEKLLDIQGENVNGCLALKER
jgi:hypothetical protein